MAMWRDLFARALWWKEYRQVRFMLWFMLLGMFMMMGFLRIEEWLLTSDDVIARKVAMYKEYELRGNSSYNWGENYAFARLLLGSLAFLMSVWQIGFERRNKISEMTFSLPYHRSTVYGVKWLLGVVFITGSMVVNGAIDILVIETSALAQFIDVHEVILASMHVSVAAIAVYTFTLGLGTVCGSWLSQTVLTGIFLFLFQFFDECYRIIKDIFYPYRVYAWSGGPPSNFSILGWVVNYPDTEYYMTILPIIIFCLLFGAWLYKHNNLEHNGRIAIFPIIEKMLGLGFAFCCSLVGGIILSNSFFGEKSGFYIGFILLGGLGYLLFSRLTRVKIKF
ncbi:hypothetical protein [Paenibacillus sp. 481]|uniref:hypothetical protein n=1 Tax=Paenibacillus sp. 481 TaxID=2835869 RepID=UPI001E3B1EC1|nr:hypothetical protein [Paenibacillus sp. 481]UHA74919.1 hypothetical protein KIK04_07740 [Paenibacillus sp. 481]